MEEEKSVDETAISEPIYPDPPSSSMAVDLDKTDGSDGDKTKCDICQIESVCKKKKDIWLNCEYRKRCNYWVHALCVGIVVKNERDLEDVQYFCPEHIKNYMK